VSSSATKRPLSVTLIALLFLISGSVGLIYHATEIKFSASAQFDLFLVLFVRLLAVVGAIFALRGHNWARWLLVIWMAYHVILSAFHSVSQTLVHTALFGVIAFFLFRRRAAVYFGTRNDRA
jgi:hypothetical protein